MFNKELCRPRPGKEHIDVGLRCKQHDFSKAILKLFYSIGTLMYHYLCTSCKQAEAKIKAHICMVYQRGQKFVFLLEHKQFVLEHEISCSITNFVLYHNLVRARARNFLLGHDLVRARARIFRARARTRSCSSTNISC